MTNQDGNFQKAIDSRSALVFSRFVMPVLLALVGGLMSVILSMVFSSVGEIKTNQAENIKQVWATVGKIHDEGQTTASVVSGIGISLQDHIRAENDIDSRLTTIVQDHEQRMRSLERPSGH